MILKLYTYIVSGLIRKRELMRDNQNGNHLTGNQFSSVTHTELSRAAAEVRTWERERSGKEFQGIFSRLIENYSLVTVIMQDSSSSTPPPVEN